MSKPFATAADTTEKTDTLEILGNGVFALTAEGDPNVGAVEGEDFVVAVESRATPAASRNWLKSLREHTLPFDVQRLWDELDCIEHPRVWTMGRDREVSARPQG